MSTLLTPAALDSMRQQPDVVVLDAQYELGGTPCVQLYDVAHVPGATPLDLDAVLAGPPGDGGRHPLPDPQVLQDGLRAAGVRESSTVVVYDQRTSLSAARAWWVLRWAGVQDVRVLDGGLAAWQEAGLAVAAGHDDVEPAREGDVVVQPGSLPVLGADDAARVAKEGVLLDARTPQRYRGEDEPVDPVAGHIPGAVNLPMAELLRSDGRLLPPDALRERVHGLGLHPCDATPVGAYCGSGVTAAHTVLALAEIGITAVPYIGSWSAWVADPDRPVATGA